MSHAGAEMMGWRRDEPARRRDQGTPRKAILMLYIPCESVQG